MRSNILNIFLFLLFYFSCFNAQSAEPFNFDVTEVQILENGNKFIGVKKGTISSNNGIVIDANQFTYDKITNILNASGNVKVNDKLNNNIIFTEKLIYDKNKEIIYTIKKSKGISPENNIEIFANDFEYDIPKNIIIAKKNVIIENKLENYQIFADLVTYYRNSEKFVTKDDTSATIDSKYNFNSKDVTFLKDSMELFSNKKTIISDKYNLYNLNKFRYFINTEELRGEKISISSNYNLPKSDQFYFSSGIINLKTQNFIAKDTEIKIHKEVFGEPDNDPRLKGTSSIKKDNITIVNKGIFTSCMKRDTCPPWSIQAGEILHDKNKKQLVYENAILRVYDFPILYFPKFFHPDPSVKRQSGFLKPQINSSKELGDSIHIPYFHVISPTKDLTFKPTLFNNNIKMFQNEYRQQNENSSFIADFSLTRGYKSSLSDKKNSISHLFAKFDTDLKFQDFDTSNLYLSVQKVTNDTYLKVFDTNLPETKLKPNSQSSLTSEIKLSLGREDYNFTTGIKSFENLGVSNNDRYQYILPYYNFDKNFATELFNGKINFSSSGSNDLNNTNNLKSKIINDLNYEGNEIISSFGIVNNFNVHFKNSNTLGKNDSNYKSSPQIELMNIYEFTSKLPLRKTEGNFNNFITPKISLRFNPSDMKNYSTSTPSITVDNVFGINRLGLDDSFEKGKSLTVGFDYKKQKLEDINKFFEFKLASVFRDSEENFISKSSSLNKKNSNLFGSVETKLTENFEIDYNFRIDNNYEKVEYNSINTNFIYNNLETKFTFVEENGEAGNENFLENSTIYKFDENNLISFNTRRNRKLNLTEFYDLLYEYKNDCLIASIKYKKKYYSDRDLKPSENLLLTLTLYPLTTYEHNETRLFKN